METNTNQQQSAEVTLGNSQVEVSSPPVSEEHVITSEVVGPERPSDTPKSSKMVLLVAMVLVLIIAISAGALYYQTQMSGAQSAPQPQEQQKIVQVSPTPTLSPEETEISEIDIGEAVEQQEIQDIEKDLKSL